MDQDDISVLVNPSNIITCYLNHINSIRNKFEMSLSAAQYVGILRLSETKLDMTFPWTQFLINVFPVPHSLFSIKMT